MRLLRIFGVDVMLHWSIVIPLAITSLNPAHFATLVLTFLVVLLHEFGHIFMTRLYSIHCNKVVLSAIGGVAVIESSPKTPISELLIAAGGPSIILLLLGLGFLYAECIETSYWWNFFMVINVFVAAFNLIPAFPSDGGRVFRAIVWFVTGRKQWATRTAIVLTLIITAIGATYSVMHAIVPLLITSMFILLIALTHWNEP